MPGGNICEENLEQRIERIRKRDEEIEKRHREAEADRLAALQANAMVKTTAPADDDWPKAHKYDKLDFTYDVKSDNTESDDAKPATEETRLQRPFKKFPEGQGPPADPTYNFLADAERDGKVQANNASNDNKNWRANSNNNKNDVASNKRNNANNSSFNRGRNGAKGKNAQQKGKSNDEPILRKNDRERNIIEPRVKPSDGMWRRNDDKKNDTKEARTNVPTSPTNKKTDDRQVNFKVDGKTGSLNTPTKPFNKLAMQQRMNFTKPDAELQQKLSDLSIEKRGNITVSVTKDGEVKSVKLEASRAIGTGRVGSGATMRHNMQATQPQAQSQIPQQQQFISTNLPVMMDSNLNPSATQTPALFNYPVIDQFKPQQTVQPAPVAQPGQLKTESPAQANTTQKPMSNIVNGVPFKLPSVQDRLIKNRVFFDENLRNGAQTSNGQSVAGNQ